MRLTTCINCLEAVPARAASPRPELCAQCQAERDAKREAAKQGKEG